MLVAEWGCWWLSGVNVLRLNGQANSLGLLSLFCVFTDLCECVRKTKRHSLLYRSPTLAAAGSYATNDGNRF